MPPELNGLMWLLLSLGPLLFLQRQLHRETQIIFLLITRRVEIALALFSFLFFPGVLLHEASHFIMARLLGVRTGRFSLLPRPQPNGRLQLGYVETAAVDWIRDGLVGAAPMLAGGAFVAYVGLSRLELNLYWAQIQAGGLVTVLKALPDLLSRPDFWLWFYLAFAISSTMLPSPSDRRAWLPLVLVFGALLSLILLAGAGPWLVQHLAGPLNRVLLSIAIVFGISVFVHLVLFLPLWGLRHLLAWMLRLEV